MKPLKAIALDVDGVLTDGGVWWGPNGEEWKRFCFADIMGVSLARKAGLFVALISGEDSPLVDRFADKMGISDVEKGCKVGFMGDDVNDLAAMQLAGVSAAPCSALPIVKRAASFVASASGGNGAVREFVDAVLSTRPTTSA
jgi:3-deoxy-D-manno-octulosonate 8-phosphate phosphatase (KDO 8-P phosphatase)